MTEETGARFPAVGDPSGLAPDDRFYREELQLANRNRGMPLEALRYPITPVGMHYLLVHFDIPEVNAGSWRLNIGGLVAKPLSLSLADIQARPRQTLPVTMECAGNGRALLDPRPVSQPWLLEAIGTSEWGGTPLRGVLEEAGVSEQAVEMVFTGADRGVQGDQDQVYQRSLSVDEVMRGEVLLAYEMNGRPLEPQHGYPLRLLVPGWYGMTSVKWLMAIEAVSEPFEGCQMIESYRYSDSPDDPGKPVTLQKVRALMVPPGIPDFLTRMRVVEAGDNILTGRVWAGRREIVGVDVSTDSGGTWSEALLEAALSPHAWRGWSYRWAATPGQHTLCVRGRDSDGGIQPTEQPWSQQGVGNNMVQRVEVIVG